MQSGAFALNLYPNLHSAYEQPPQPTAPPLDQHLTEQQIALNEQAYWQHKFHKHFPAHIYKKLHAELSKKTDIDWLVEFQLAENMQYGHLTPKQRLLFHFIKENKTRAVINLGVTYDDINKSDGSEYTLLGIANINNNQQVLDFFYQLALAFFFNSKTKNIIEINKKDASEHTLLHLAICCRQPVNVIDGLLQQGWDINAKTRSKNTPLHAAALFNYKDGVRTLLQHGAFQNPVSISDRTPLHIAIANNQCEITEILLNHGADPNLKFGYDMTPLMSAINSGNLKIIEALLTHHADANVPVRINNEIHTPLIHAIYLDRPDIAKLLLQHGADPNKTIREGLFPLLGAVLKNNLEMVNVLLNDNHIDVNLPFTTTLKELKEIKNTVPKDAPPHVVAAVMRFIENIEADQQPHGFLRLFKSSQKHDSKIKLTALDAATIITETTGNTEIADAIRSKMESVNAGNSWW